jgi:sugar lactone lactonase YvrE
MKRTTLLALMLTAPLAACQGQEDPVEPPNTTGEGAREELVLAGDSFYPEGIAVAADGTFFVGSFSSGEIVQIRPGQRGSAPFIGAMGGAIAAGMIVDDAKGALWVCALDPMLTAPAVVKRFDTKTAAETGSYAFPGTVCNDLALDKEGNLYATDSLDKTIYRLPAGGEEVAAWLTDEVFGGDPGVFTLNGIAFDGGSSLYTVKYNTGELFRIAINADGTAGAVTPIAVTPPIAWGDGLKALSADRLLVVENDAGRLSVVDLSGDAGAKTVLADDLAEPTTAAVYKESAWVVEGQLSFYFGVPGEPSLPFRVRRVALE